MRFRLLATIALLAFASAVRADTLVLKTGAKLEGDLKRVDGGWEVVLADGRVQFVAAEEVKSVVLAPAGRLTENVAQERLASLRRSVEAEKTIERIIQRYEQFVLTSQNTQAGASAEADLQMWRDRLEKKFVRYGRVWMLPEDRLKVIRESVSMIEKIQVLAQAGHFAEEQALIDEQLAKNPSDISFIYLDGVLKLRQGEFGAARKSFEAVSRVAREHAPTLNNLAAAHFGLRRETGAINPLDRALQAAPGVQALIDNAAELLHTLDRTPPRNSPTDRLLRRFAEQDRALQQQMQQKGLYRWGSSWVEETKIKELQAIQKEIDAKLREFDTQRNQSLSRQEQIVDNIESNELMMRRIADDSVYIDAQGRMIRSPLPNAYYEYQRDNVKLKAELERERAAVTDLDKQAEQLQNSYPIPLFKGALQIIGEEGVPLVLPGDVSPDEIFAPEPTTMPDSSTTQNASDYSGITVVMDEETEAQSDDDRSEDHPSTAPNTQPTTQPN